jgi:hypothetical protein
LNLEGGGGVAGCCAEMLAVPATNRNARTVSDCTSFVRIVFPPQISY